MLKRIVMGATGNFKRLLNDTSGNFALMFGICGTALVLCVAGSIDLMGMQRQKSNLQFLTDSGALAAASLRTDKIADIKKAAEAAVDANNVDGLAVDVKVSLDGDIIRVEAKSEYDAQLMGIFGMDDIPVNSISEAPVPEENPVNIALVLDSTGSMAGTNMDDLKSAAKKLLEVFDESEPGTIQAGVVPYNRYVNVGLSNRNRPWMDVADDSTTTSPEVCYMRTDIVSQDCTSTSSPNTCYNDAGPYECTSTSTTCTNQVYGPEYEYCYTPTSSETWHGCVGSRDDPDHKEPGYKGSKFPGIMNVTCGAEILDLTTDLNAVGDHIDTLTTSGNTYIPTGLAWGWRLLHADNPFGGLSNAETKRKRALVLMTDGANTVRLSAPHHHNSYDAADKTNADALTLELCDSIKNDGIDVYTVAYKLPSGDTSSIAMVEQCASSAGQFFLAENREDLEKAFEQIAESLFEIRLSR